MSSCKQGEQHKIHRRTLVAFLYIYIYCVQGEKWGGPKKKASLFLERKGFKVRSLY